MSTQPVAQAVPQPEAIAPQPTPVVAPAPVADPRIAQLAKKEAALVQERQAIKKERETFQSKIKQIEEVNAKIAEYEAIKSKNPYEALKMLGYNDTDIFNALAAAPEPTPEDKLLAKVDERLNEREKREQEASKARQAEADKKTIDGFKKKIASSITTAADKYEFCSYHGEAAQEQVYELIETHLKDTGELIPLEEALETVEEFYEQSAREMSERVSKLKPKTQEAAPADVPLTAQIKPASSSVSGSITPESREAKKQRLMALIKQNGLKR